MDISTKVTKSTVFSQLSSCCSSVLPVVRCRVTVYLSQGSALSQVNYDPQNSLSGGERNPQSSSRSVNTVSSSPRSHERYSAEIILFYRRQEAGMCVWQCRAETVQSPERSGEKRRGKGSWFHLKRDVQLCYGEGGLRVRSVRLKKRLHSEEPRGGTPAPTVTSGMLPPGSVFDALLAENWKIFVLNDE